MPCECGRLAFARGLCRPCYMRAYRQTARYVDVCRGCATSFPLYLGSLLCEACDRKRRRTTSDARRRNAARRRKRELAAEALRQYFQEVPA